MFLYGRYIGHAGNIFADDVGRFGVFGLCSDKRARFHRQQFAVVHKNGKQFLDDSLRFHVHARNRRRRVEIFFQKPAQQFDVRFHAVGKVDHELLLLPGVVTASDFVFGDIVPAVFQHVKNHPGNHVAGNGVDFKIVVCTGMLFFEFFKNVVDKRQLAQLFNAEKTGSETVVDVMVVIGDVVGNRADLSFQ